MKLYGSEIHSSCVLAKSIFDEKNIPYTYIDITECTTNLKEFLSIRDNNNLYDNVKVAARFVYQLLYFDSRIGIYLYKLNFQDIIENFVEKKKKITICADLMDAKILKRAVAKQLFYYGFD